VETPVKLLVLLKFLLLPLTLLSTALLFIFALFVCNMLLKHSGSLNLQILLIDSVVESQHHLTLLFLIAFDDVVPRFNHLPTHLLAR
jgi:hypothetical protein